MQQNTIGKGLLTLSALWAGDGPFVFDWNETHIHNPAWPPHAIYHNAQTISLGVGLALATVASPWGGGRRPLSSDRLASGTTTASLYWATQLSSLAFPGVALVDPPATRRGPQAYIASAGLVVNAVGYLLQRRTLRAG